MNSKKDDIDIVHKALINSVNILSRVFFSMHRIQNKKAIKGFDLLSEALIESSNNTTTIAALVDGMKNQFGAGYEKFKDELDDGKI